VTQGDAPERGVRVVIASDGKRGHLNQSLVIARMLGDEQPLVMQLRNPAGGLAERLLRARFALPGCGAIRRGAAARIVRRMLKPESPDSFRQFAHDVHDSGRGKAGADNRGGLRIFTVSTGTPPATLNLVLARLLDAEAVVNMTPSLLPRRLFTLQIIPRHDLHGRPPPAGAVVSPLSLGYYDATQAAHMASDIRSRSGLGLDARCFGLAIGGPSRSAPWNRETVVAAVTAMLKACKREGLSVLATTSRRTPAWFTEWLKNEGRALADIPFLLDAAADQLNPLPGMYDMCAGIAISADSFSMASEAIHAGHTPLLLRASPAPMRPKLERGLAGIVDATLARWYTRGDGVSAVLGLPRREANTEYVRLRGLVREKLAL
jgi:mitochondrial fission protein ELM1